MPDLISKNWKDYELIDFGNQRKLERFGPYILDRPEVNANNLPSLQTKEWNKLSDAKFNESSNTRGEWTKMRAIPDKWTISIALKQVDLEVEIQLGSSKHIGIFPEQMANWQYIDEQNLKNGKRFLNLFAYTGIASLVANGNGADVFHVESLKQLLQWGKLNMQLSQLNNIHWVCEDVLLFVKRESKREHKYDFIILDPPVFGRGPKGERWQLEQKMSELMQYVGQILNKPGRIVLNTYSPKITLEDMAALCKLNGVKGKFETGNLCLESRFGKLLPMSLYVRNQ